MIRWLTIKTTKRGRACSLRGDQRTKSELHYAQAQLDCKCLKLQAGGFYPYCIRSQPEAGRRLSV